MADGIADGLDLMEVEFPAVPGEDASYKAASDVYIDLNIQYALTVFSKLHKETGKTCELLVPDGPEYRRAKKVFANSLELSEGCTINTLDGRKTENVGSFFGNVFGGKGLRTREDEDALSCFPATRKSMFATPPWPPCASVASAWKGTPSRPTPRAPWAPP